MLSAGVARKGVKLTRSGALLHGFQGIFKAGRKERREHGDAEDAEFSRGNSPGAGRQDPDSIYRVSLFGAFPEMQNPR